MCVCGICLSDLCQLEDLKDGVSMNDNRLRIDGIVLNNDGLTVDSRDRFLKIVL